MSTPLRTRLTVWFIACAFPLAGLAAAVAVLEAEDIADAKPLVIALAVLALVGFVAGWLVIRRSTLARLEHATDAARLIAEGVRVDPIRDRIPDELGRLNAALDDLAEQRNDDEREREQAEEHLRHQSVHDGLTGIANRPAFRAMVEAELAVDGQAPLAVVMVDLDDFALVNDLWGQAVGDEVLVAVANRLRRLLGDDAAIARWSGDEFAILVSAVEPVSLDGLAGRIENVIGDPFTTTAGPQTVGACVVAVTAERGTTTVDQLFREIDAGIRDQKTLRASARAINPETARLVELALDKGGLEVWYQPIVTLISQTGTRMVGAEAFVRLRGDDGKVHVAGDFLGDIIASEYARAIDQQMARLIIGDLASWRERNLVPDDFLVSLNLSPASLRDLDLGRSLVAVCRANHVSPANIVLDVSEEAGELDQIIAAELRQSGFRLSIDDLGLKRSNFDRLFAVGAEFAKLHRRWLNDEIMLDAMVSICRRKGLQIVAEGVETMDQLALLHDHGVRLAQGYLISHPLPVGDFEALLGVGRDTAAAMQ